MRDQEFKECLDEIIKGSTDHVKKLFAYFKEDLKEGKSEAILNQRKKEAFQYFFDRKDHTDRSIKGYANLALGDCYYHGYGVDKHKRRAATCYDTAVNLGAKGATWRLALSHYYGDIDYYNNEDAVELLKFGAGVKDSYAQYLLGYMYMHGLGIEQNSQEALKYFTLAAEQGEDEAYVMMGIMYQCGIGITRNFDQATAAFQRALQLNPRNTKAISRLKIDKISRIYDLYWCRTPGLVYSDKVDKTINGNKRYKVTIKLPDIDLREEWVPLVYSDPLVIDEASKLAGRAYIGSCFGKVINSLIGACAVAVVVGGVCIYYGETYTGIGLIASGIFIGLCLYAARRTRIDNLTTRYANKIAIHIFEKDVADLLISADKQLVMQANQQRKEALQEVKQFEQRRLDNIQRQEGEPEPGAEGYTFLQSVAVQPVSTVRTSGVVQQREMSGLNYRPTNANPSAPLPDQKDHIVYVPPKAV